MNKVYFILFLNLENKSIILLGNILYIIYYVCTINNRNKEKFNFQLFILMALNQSKRFSVFFLVTK